jgi:hypothetical protein
VTDPELDDTTIARAPASADASPASAADPASADVAPAEAGGEQTASAQTPPQYGVGPFTIREVALAGVWLVAFILSFLPLNAVDGGGRALFGGTNVWVSGLSWILAIGLPTVAVFLLVLRRLSPQGIRRFGSLGIDQFASVAFSVAALVWLTWLWDTIAIAIEVGVWTRSWVVWVEVILMLAGVALTVFAPIIPVLEQDFQDRPEVPAHRHARPVRPVTPRPARPRTAKPAHTQAPGPVAGSAFNGGAAPSASPQTETYDTGADAPVTAQDTGSFDTDVFAPLREDAAAEPETRQFTAVAEPASAEPASAEAASARQQAFWALAPVERDVVDEYGNPLFRIGPTAWALVIEDRGEVFVVRHEDGRIGYLHDVSGVTRG